MAFTQGQYNKAAKCPYCGMQSDGATGNGVPKEFDYAVCLYCGEVGVYTADLNIRRPKFKEHREIKLNENVQRHIQMVKQIMKKR